ncbi:hypothetical protein VU00_11513, partial [Candidatus Electrothrix marina]
AEAEELAKQDEEGENSDNKADAKAEDNSEEKAVSEEKDTPKQEQQDDSAE